MTLKNQIALTFTLLTSGLLLGISIIIYYFSYQHTLHDFYQRLHERANIVAIFLLEEDELNQRIYNEIRTKYLQSLILEQEYLVPLDKPLKIYDLPDIIDSSFVEKISRERYASKTVGQISVLGIRYEDNQGTFAVMVSARDDWGIRKLHNLQRILVAIVLSYLLLVFFIGRWYALQTLAPLTDIIYRMRTINTSNLHLRLPESDKSDELNQLAHTFNNLLNRIETSVESQHNFISNASHELKNPLTAILGQIELALQSDRSAAEYRQSLIQIEQEAERLKNLTLHLLRLAQTGFGDAGKDFTAVRLDELLLEVVEELQQTNAKNRILLHFAQLPEEARELELSANPNLLKIAFNNVIENALKFAPEQTTEVFFILTASHFIVRVQDQGIGIPEGERANVFEPFFRGSNTVSFQGFGVGLPLVKKIMSIHEGTVEIQSIENKNTTVILNFPRE